MSGPPGISVLKVKIYLLVYFLSNVILISEVADKYYIYIFGLISLKHLFASIKQV